MQAQKISRKAVAAGFEWDSVAHVWEKVHEEARELQEAYARAPKSENGKMLKNTPEFHEAELEMGDVLFSLVNVARKMVRCRRRFAGNMHEVSQSLGSHGR